jgi:hypothetical protein
MSQSLQNKTRSDVPNFLTTDNADLKHCSQPSYQFVSHLTPRLPAILISCGQKTKRNQPPIEPFWVTENSRPTRFREGSSAEGSHNLLEQRSFVLAFRVGAC